MKSVVLCGSRRFKPEIRKFVDQLKKAGVVVYEPYLHDEPGKWEKYSESERRYVALGLTHDHFYKIRMADIVYIFNKNGYSGVSTTMEIAYAVAFNKPIYVYSDKDEEYTRKVLFRGVLKTPKELLKLLR